MCVSVYVYVCVCVCLYVCMSVCGVCLHGCMSVYVYVCREAKRGRTSEHSSEVPREMDEERGGEGGQGNMSPLTQEQNIRIQQLKAQVNNVHMFRQERIRTGGLSKSM